jgi:hypothetical protein
MTPRLRSRLCSRTVFYIWFWVQLHGTGSLNALQFREHNHVCYFARGSNNAYKGLVHFPFPYLEHRNLLIQLQFQVAGKPSFSTIHCTASTTATSWLTLIICKVCCRLCTSFDDPANVNAGKVIHTAPHIKAFLAQVVHHSLLVLPAIQTLSASINQSQHQYFGSPVTSCLTF